MRNSFRSENITWCAWSVTKKGSCLSHGKILIEHALTVQFTYQSMGKPETTEKHTQHAINVEASSSRSIEKYLSFQLCTFFISTTEWYSPTSFIMTPWHLLSRLSFPNVVTCHICSQSLVTSSEKPWRVTWIWGACVLCTLSNSFQPNVFKFDISPDFPLSSRPVRSSSFHTVRIQHAQWRMPLVCKCRRALERNMHHSFQSSRTQLWFKTELSFSQYRDW